MPLLRLHHIIQAATGWTDAHLHAFTIGGVRYGIPHEDDDPDLPRGHERAMRLARTLEPGLSFDYRSDFGDQRIHGVCVETSGQMHELDGANFVIDGARACPLEDDGISGGYQDSMDGLGAEPRDEEVVSCLEWAGTDLDPERFDRRAANAALMRVAWSRWGEK